MEFRFLLVVENMAYNSLILTELIFGVWSVIYRFFVFTFLG